MKPKRPSYRQRLAERVADWSERRVEQGEQERIVRIIKVVMRDPLLPYQTTSEVLRQLVGMIERTSPIKIQGWGGK